MVGCVLELRAEDPGNFEKPGDVWIDWNADCCHYKWRAVMDVFDRPGLAWNDRFTKYVRKYMGPISGPVDSWILTTIIFPEHLIVRARIPIDGDGSCCEPKPPIIWLK
jgi:hypothetical protein